MITNQKNAQCSAQTQEMQGKKHKTVENPIQSLEYWTFPSILMRILKENGYFFVSLSLSLSPMLPLAVTPLKVALFSSFVGVFGHSNVSAPCFWIVAAARKHGFYPMIVQIVCAVARISFTAAKNFLAVAPQLGPSFFLRHLSSNSLHFSQVFILYENKPK